MTDTLQAEANDNDARLTKIGERISELVAEKNGAYRERNQCVAALAHMARLSGFKVGMGFHPAQDTTWDPDWRTIVFIELPLANGGLFQASWHIHESERDLFRGLPNYDSAYDGHTTADKYAAMAELANVRWPRRG